MAFMDFADTIASSGLTGNRRGRERGRTLRRDPTSLVGKGGPLAGTYLSARGNPLTESHTNDLGYIGRHIMAGPSVIGQIAALVADVYGGDKRTVSSLGKARPGVAQTSAAMASPGFFARQAADVRAAPVLGNYQRDNAGPDSRGAGGGTIGGQGLGSGRGRQGERSGQRRR